MRRAYAALAVHHVALLSPLVGLVISGVRFTPGGSIRCAGVPVIVAHHHISRAEGRAAGQHGPAWFSQISPSDDLFIIA